MARAVEKIVNYYVTTHSALVINTSMLTQEADVNAVSSSPLMTPAQAVQNRVDVSRRQKAPGKKEGQSE